MHPKERPSPTRSPTPETEWSRDFANSYYHGRPPHPISPPPKRRVFDLNDEELNRSKYEQKRALYMRKYRGNFDENKLPQYLRSFEAFMVGREEYLRNRINNNNNNNNRPTFRHRDTRETSSPQSSERDEQEFIGRPLITLRRQSSPFNRFERRFQRENVSRSRSQSRSPSLSSVPRFRSFSRSRSRSPPAIRYSRPAAPLRSPTRSWSRSPCRLISFRSSSRQNGVQARSGPRTPSTSPPPSRERSHDSFYSQRGQPPKVRSRTPLNSPPSFVPQSRSQSRSPPRHREKRPLERPSGSPGQMHRTDSQPPHLLLPGLVDIGGEPIAGSSRSFLQHQSPVVASVKPEIRIILKQSPNGAQPSHHQQHLQYQSHLVQSPVYANPQILAYPETLTLAQQLPQLPPQQSPHVIEYQTATTPHPPQSGYKRNTELPPIPGAVPLDVEDETDDASSMISDFHKLPNRPYFVKGEHNIYFTPCLATFYENIRLAWKELIYPPRFFDVITSYTDSRRMKLARALEATIVLAVGQSCALSYNLTTEKKSVVAEQLLKAELPVLRAFRMIASQYGSVKCEQTGDFLKPIDHTGDIRAIVRMASHLLPERETEAQCENGQPDKELTILSDEEGSNVATRSWLPTYNADKRFFWIFALKVKEFMHSRLGIFSQPMETVQELAAPRKTIPRWWTIFRDQLPGEASGRFDFLWHDWNETTFYENLGSHPAGAMALEAIGLTWPTPEQSHLNFNINLREEIPRIYRYIFQDLELYLTNFKLMVMQQLGPAHYGSWNQLASVINFMGWNVFKNCRETDKATQNLALRFPPRVYHDMEL